MYSFQTPGGEVGVLLLGRLLLGRAFLLLFRLLGHLHLLLLGHLRGGLRGRDNTAVRARARGRGRGEVGR